MGILISGQPAEIAKTPLPRDCRGSLQGQILGSQPGSWIEHRDEDSHCHSKMVDLVPTGYRFHDLVLWHPRSV